MTFVFKIKFILSMGFSKLKFVARTTCIYLIFIIIVVILHNNIKV